MEIELEKSRDHVAVSKLLQLREKVQNLQRDQAVIETSAFPAVDVVDTGESFVLMVDLPNVTVEALDIVIQDDVVQLSGYRSFDVPGQVLTQERQQGSFERLIHLPGAVDLQASNAALKLGVLTLILPKLV